jgi:hypothetical protein
VLVLEGQSQGDQPIVLSEFGGICYAPGVEGVWGYSRTATARQFARQYSELLLAVRNIGVLTGFCYTQFADTYQEANGLLFADRTPKFPLDEIAAATSGRTAGFIPEPEHEEAPGRP